MEDEELNAAVRPVRRGASLAAALLVAACFVASASAQRFTPANPPKEKPPGAAKKEVREAEACPYCHNDPALLQASGVVSHGPFPFGKTDTEKVAALLPAADIRWAETPNFRIGFALGSHKVKFEERKKILAELTRLQALLPDVKPETSILDPWLRVHLYAQRTADIHQRFVTLLRLEGVQFADGSGVWRERYMGEGPYLGMRDKYEILVLPNEDMHVIFLKEHTGLSIKHAQRWHYVDRGVMGVMLHAEDGQVRIDMALHARVAFNLAHNLYDGLKHYAYDTPVWIHEGLAHFMEREISPDFNSFDSGEGAVANITSKSNWKAEVLKLLAAGNAPRLAELINLKTYADLELPHHFATWSMTDYLIATQPEAYAKFLWAVKSSVDDKGAPSGSNLPELQRQKFKEIFGMSYAEFDQAWSAWCAVNYRPGGPGNATAADTKPQMPGPR